MKLSGCKMLRRDEKPNIWSGSLVYHQGGTNRGTNTVVTSVCATTAVLKQGTPEVRFMLWRFITSVRDTVGWS
jgi:hypothetical protein